MAQLSQEEIDACREAYTRFDKDGSGSIGAEELRQVLEALGQRPSDEEVFLMISNVDEANSGAVDFSQFLRIIQHQKVLAEMVGDESDTVEAYVTLGGDADKGGKVSTEKLRAVIKDFGLKIDIDNLILEADLDGSGYIEYNEFAHMLQKGTTVVASLHQE